MWCPPSRFAFTLPRCVRALLPFATGTPQAPRQQPQTSDEEMRNANPLVMLLRSLLPWVNVGQQPEYGDEEEDDGEEGGEGQQGQQ